MKTVKKLFILIVILLSLVSVFVEPLRNWLLASMFNVVRFFEHSVKFTDSFDPIYVWTVYFGMLGAAYGILRAMNKFRLSHVMIIPVLLAFFLPLFLSYQLARPLEAEKSDEVREAMLVEWLEDSVSFQFADEYVKRFPEGEIIDRVRNMHEQVLWDSANTQPSEAIWAYYLKHYPESRRSSNAKAQHQKLLWEKAERENTIASYERYLDYYAEGRLANTARSNIETLRAESSGETEPDPVEKHKPPRKSDPKEPAIEDAEPEVTVRIGELELEGGRIYEGEIRNGIPHGKGKELFPDGSYLKGQWIDGLREGSFTFHGKDGSEQTQYFKEGNRIR